MTDAAATSSGGMFSSAWVKLLTLLSIVTMATTIYAQFVAMKRTWAEAAIKKQIEINGDLRQKSEATTARYLAEIKRAVAVNALKKQTAEANQAKSKSDLAKAMALNAELRTKAEAEAKKFEADIEEQKAINARLLLSAQAQSEHWKAKIKEATAPYAMQKYRSEAECFEARVVKARSDIRIIKQSIAQYCATRRCR